MKRQLFVTCFFRFTEFDGLIDSDTDPEQQDYNVFLEFCFPDVFGPNFGFSTLIEFEDECIVGKTCNESGDSISIEEDSNTSQEDDAGRLYLLKNCKSNVLIELIYELIFSIICVKILN